jgi:hypothetical protein
VYSPVSPVGDERTITSFASGRGSFASAAASWKLTWEADQSKPEQPRRGPCDKRRNLKILNAQIVRARQNHSIAKARSNKDRNIARAACNNLQSEVGWIQVGDYQPKEV